MRCVFFHDLNILYVTVSVNTSTLMQMTHVYIVLDSRNYQADLSELSSCFEAVQIWMAAVKLKLNPNKTSF